MFSRRLRWASAGAIVCALSCHAGITATQDDGGPSSPEGDAGKGGTEGGPSDDAGGGTGGSCPPAGEAELLWADVVNMGGVASDGTNLFWSASNAIWSCPVTGCTGKAKQIAPLTSGNPTPVVIDATHVYFQGFSGYVDAQSSGSILRCPKAGCTGPAEVVAAKPTFSNTALAIDDQAVYWSTCGGYNCDGQVMRIGKDGSDLRAIGGSHNGPQRLAVTTTTVFWIDGPTNGAGADGSILSCPLSGCSGPPTVVAANQENPTDIAVDANNVYWTLAGSFFGPGALDGAVLSCPLSGCGGAAPTPVATHQPYPMALLVDDCGIYWSNEGRSDAGPKGSTIQACTKPACKGDPILLAKDQRMPRYFGMDQGAIYWTDDQTGSVARLAR